MAPKVVRYYFGFASPFAALADALVGEAGATLDPRFWGNDRLDFLLDALRGRT